MTAELQTPDSAGTVADPAPPLPADAAATDHEPRVAAQVVEIVQTMIVALILAFVFRAFLVEAFVIPTGSMAESLLGAHATRTCPACGWEFDVSLTGSSSDSLDVLCPNCHLRTAPHAGDLRVKGGDRILVHKWPYELGGWFGPHRWEVIVFRDPADPDQNYIKRLVALPNETIEIVDGDVFIDGHIARKPAAAQNVLWFVTFDQDHLPRPTAPSADPPRWIAESDNNGAASPWRGLDERIVSFDGPDDVPRAITFSPTAAREYVHDMYGYNRRSSGAVVADVRVRTELTWRAGDGRVEFEWARGGRRFVAELRRDGMATLRMDRAAPGSAPAAPETLMTARLGRLAAGRPLALEFTHVDYRVSLRVDGREVLWTSDDQYAPDLEALRAANWLQPARIRIVGAAAQFDLRGLRLDRDVYYTYATGRTERAYAGEPFTLHAQEYFVLGDNSPDSHDSREWTERGPHLPDDYRPGTVRWDQIVGQAAFVYLPGVHAWFVPDFGRVRFVR